MSLKIMEVEVTDSRQMHAVKCNPIRYATVAAQATPEPHISISVLST